MFKYKLKYIYIFIFNFIKNLAGFQVNKHNLANFVLQNLIVYV